MKRNTVLKLLTLAIMTSAANFAFALTSLSSSPLNVIQRTDTIVDTMGDRIPPVRIDDSSDIGHDTTVNEREYVRNNDWESEDRQRNDPDNKKRNGNDRNENGQDGKDNSTHHHGG